MLFFPRIRPPPVSPGPDTPFHTATLFPLSVVLRVAPPARKKVRRTRPTTASSCPEGHSSTAGGASNLATGTDSAGPPSGLTLSSSARTVSPEGKVRASGARGRVPTRIDRLVPAEGRVLVGRGSSAVEGRAEIRGASCVERGGV